MNKKAKIGVVVVGCGGVTYHGLTRMGNWCAQRGERACKVVLVDPDTVDQVNPLRQWGRVGEKKVDVMANALRAVNPHGIEGLVSLDTRMKEDTKLVPVLGEVDRMLVVSAPDNHMARVDTHAWAVVAAQEHKLDIVEVTGGNDLEGGYAFGCRISPDGKVMGDWTTIHQDVKEEAEQERAFLANPHSCGELGSPGQSTESNTLTAACVWGVAKRMWNSEWTGEMTWGVDPSSPSRIYVRTIERG